METRPIGGFGAPVPLREWRRMIPSDFDPSLALRLARTCRLAKEDSAAIERQARDRYGFSFARFYDSGYGPEAYVAGTDGEVVVVFRGTDRVKPDREDKNLPRIAKDWQKNLNYAPARGPFGGWVHASLYRVLVDSEGRYTEFWSGILEAIDAFRDAFRGETWCTGCSQGGIMASFAAALSVISGRPIDGIYTFGSPCPGDRVFADGLSAQVPRFFRVVNHNDLFATLPPPFMRFGSERVRYTPAGKLVYLNQDGSLGSEPPASGRFSRRVRELRSVAGELFTDVDPDEGLRRLTATFAEGLTDHLIESYVSVLEGRREGGRATGGPAVSAGAE